MPELLALENFRVDYGPVTAVDNIRLSVQEGEIVTVIGPNGAGKSTLLNAIMGLLPWQGALRWRGAAVSQHSVEAMFAAGVALVPEKRELFGAMSVRDNLLLGGFRHAMARRVSTSDIDEVFHIFPRLRERQAQLAATLSGGERQMLAIGRALMSRPRLLLLDEPSLGLAPLVVREVIEVVSSLRQRGVAVLLVEQNARAALRIADRAYVLELGSIALAGSASALAGDPRVMAAYLGGLRINTQRPASATNNLQLL
jgi:branched-chain amino acid transport system ATP-binding protein